MYKHILVPTDGSVLSAKAAATGTRLARALGARVTGVFVAPPFTPPMYGEGTVYAMPVFTPQQHRKAVGKVAEKALATIEAEAKAAGVDCKTVSATGDAPWEAIIRVAKAKKCDLIVMASHGRRGIAGLLLGSETVKVLTHSKFPVLVCR